MYWIDSNSARVFWWPWYGRILWWKNKAPLVLQNLRFDDGNGTAHVASGVRIQLAEHQGFRTPYTADGSCVMRHRVHLMLQCWFADAKQCNMHLGRQLDTQQSHPAHTPQSQGYTPARWIRLWVSAVKHWLSLYLHQCLRVVSGPLLETAAMGKSAETWEGQHRSNPVCMSDVWLFLAVRTPYCRSILSRISFASHSPYSSTRYLHTHLTKWSLNVPLMIWCNRSGELIL